MFTLAEVSNFIVHFEKCIVKTFKQAKGSKIAKGMTDLGFCLEKKVHRFISTYIQIAAYGQLGRIQKMETPCQTTFNPDCFNLH